MAVDEAERAEGFRGRWVALHLVHQPGPRQAQAKEAGRPRVLRSVLSN
jgi:hypothetical protein